MGIIQRQGIQSALITYTGILIGSVSLLLIQPKLLTAEEIGLTRILYSFSFLVSTLLPLGIVNITTRFFPKFRNTEKNHHGFFGFMLIGLGAGCLLFLPLLWLFDHFFKSLYLAESPLFSNYFNYVFPLSVIIALISTFSNYLYSVFKPIIPAFAQEILLRILFIILILIYILGGINLADFVALYTGTYFLQLIIISIPLITSGNISLKIDRSVFTPKIIRSMINYGWMVFAAGIASMAIKLLDVVVLGQFVALDLVGIYGIAAFVPTFIEAPLTALDKIANSRISHAWEKSNIETIRDIYYKSSRYLFLLGGILFLFVVINAPYLIKLLPFKYKAGVPVIEILSLGALFNLMTGSNTAIIFTSERFHTGAIGLIAVSIIHLVLLYILIPNLGLEGAAWATMLASLLYNSFKFFYIKYRFKFQPFEKRTLFIAISIVVTYGAAKLVPVTGNVITDVALHSFVIILVYGLLIWYSRSADDLKSIIPFFRKKA